MGTLHWARFVYTPSQFSYHIVYYDLHLITPLSLQINNNSIFVIEVCFVYMLSKLVLRDVKLLILLCYLTQTTKMSPMSYLSASWNGKMEKHC